MCSGITRGPVLKGELYAQRLQNSSAFIHTMFHEDFFSIVRTNTVRRTLHKIYTKQSVNKC